MYRIQDNGIAIKASQPCNFDILRYYAVLSETVLSNAFAPFFVRWNVNDRVFSGEFKNIAALIQLMNDWDVGGNWAFETEENFILGGNPLNNYGKLTIEILLANSSIVADYSTRLSPKNAGIPLGIGEHQVTIQDLATNCMDTIQVKVVCTTLDTIAIALDIGQTRTLCLNNEELLSEVSTIKNMNLTSDFYSIEPQTVDCLKISGIKLGMDSMLLLACDSFGVCDTTFLIVSVRKKLTKIRQLVSKLGETSTFCINPNELALPGNIVVFSDACGSDTPEIAALAYDKSSLCFTYTGVATGKDSICTLVCDNFGNCDTLQFKISVARAEVVYDTLFVNVDKVKDCLNIDGLLGLNILMDETCHSKQVDSKIEFKLDPNTLCVEYSGKTLGRDSACVWLVDEFGNAKLKVYQIDVIQATVAYVQDSVFINETINFCVDSIELRGNPVRLFNICPRSSGSLVEFFISSDYCLEITGVDLGKEEACLVLCDDLGYCDTTFLTVVVVPYQFPPQATNDNASTNQNTPVVINVQANDDTKGGINVISVVNPPKYGRAIVLSNGTIQYFPDNQSCRGKDEFGYLICNNTGCDNATVTIEVQCDGVEVYTGFSPNGDGWNDVFFIANIESKPNNLLRVFNRWGNLVYEINGYKNNWNGNWNGKLLPDGTYFYILEITEEDKTLTYKGSVEIHR